MEQQGLDTLKNIHTGRGRVYTFLKQVFSRPVGEDFYKLLQDMLPYLKNISEAGENKEMIEGVSGLSSFMDKLNGLKGEEYDEYNLETQRHYTSIMCLPNVAPQEESYYTSKEHLLCQESHDEMVALFKKYKLQLSLDNVYYDNIAVELSFMAHLAFKSVDSVEDRVLLKEQYDFHINHFDKWIYDFFGRVILSTIGDVELFKYLSLFAQGYIMEDKLLLEDMLSVIQ